MEDVADQHNERTTEEGGRFGLRPFLGCSDDTNPCVLTALEGGARAGREDLTRSPEGVYQLGHPRLSGKVSVRPGATSGSSRVRLDLKDRHADNGVRLHAEVRSTWIAAVCSGYQEPARKAVALAAALAKLATIPGQRTVSVSSDDNRSEVSHQLQDYVALFEPSPSDAPSRNGRSLVRV